MGETETVAMIREDGLPGHESRLDPRPDWAPQSKPAASAIADVRNVTPRATCILVFPSDAVRA